MNNKLTLKIRGVFRKFLLFYYRKNCKKYAEVLGVKFGKGCSIASKEFPHEGYLIEFGDYVRVAAHASFYTHGAIVAFRRLYSDPKLDQFGKIKVGSYTSIGSYAMIMPGVTIGERCIIAGGAVVTKSIPDGCMVAGNPAKFIGYTDNYYKVVKEKYDFGTKEMSDEEKRDFLLKQPEDKFIKKNFIKFPEA